MQRKMATIMVGDIVESTKKMELDEESAVQLCEKCLGAVSDTVTSHEGRVFNRQGDALLAEFQSPVNALRASMAARGALASVGNMGPGDMRFGLHLADVLDMDGDLRGDGVNIAARIQSSAAPGTIDVSGVLFEQVRRNSPCVFDDLGERSFKGISELIRIYRVREQLDRHRLQASRPGHTSVVNKRPYSIAVMPFRTASSADEDQQFIAEGLTEDIILELGRFRRLFVVSRSASMALETQDPVVVGNELGVRYVLSGSVRKLGSRLRLNLSLMETDTGSVVWTERIQRPYEEFIEFMDEVTARISATVLGRVEETDLTTARLRPPETMGAYESYLRGLDFHRRGGVTEENMREAAKWFERAIEIDPNFARAQAMHVCAAWGLDGYAEEDLIARVQRALELDPNDPEANRIMGSILMYSGEFKASEQYHTKALKLAPNDAYIVGRCAAYYLFSGDYKKALELLDRAEELDPYLPVWCTEERVAAYYVVGRYEAALEAARRLAFQTRRTSLYRVASRVALGDGNRARQILSEAIAANPGLDDEYLLSQEHYQDKAIIEALLNALYSVGLPKKE